MHGFSTALTILAICVVNGAWAGERLLEPAPCPVSKTLRVADAQSLEGLASLAQCGPRVVVSPASPADFAPPSNDRIVPRQHEADPVRMTAAEKPAVAAPSSAPGGAARSARPLAVALPTPETLLTLRPARYATPYDGVIGAAAARHRIDPLLLHAVVAQESSYRVDALSPAGARGLMQLMPGTARMLGISGAAILDAHANVDGGARLLRRLYGRYGDFGLTLAAYNAGEGAVQRYGNRIPPFAETRNYVRSVLARYQRLAVDHGLIGR